MQETQEYIDRFSGITRLYGVAGAETLRNAHVCVVGLGGVGSWAVESLARSGVGTITLIDFDEVSLSNMNRQLPALTQNAGRKKISVMVERIQQINPDCVVNPIDDFITAQTCERYMSRGYDYVIDAIDSIKFKSMMIAYCRRAKIPIITTGGAGGLTDPTRIMIADVSKTYNDPLISRVRAQLRKDYGFTSNPKRRFGVECVFSSQQPVYPKPDGTVSCQKPGIHGISLDCRLGYGSACGITASFGLFAATRAINKLIERSDT